MSDIIKDKHQTADRREIFTLLSVEDTFFLGMKENSNFETFFCQVYKTMTLNFFNVFRVYCPMRQAEMNIK